MKRWKSWQSAKNRNQCGNGAINIACLQRLMKDTKDYSAPYNTNTSASTKEGILLPHNVAIKAPADPFHSRIEYSNEGGAE